MNLFLPMQIFACMASLNLRGSRNFNIFLWTFAFTKYYNWSKKTFYEAIVEVSNSRYVSNDKGKT